MPAMNSQLNQSSRLESDAVAAVWGEIRSYLEVTKAQLYEEINNYPLPITACDEQFNYLLEKRSRICQELGRLNAASTAMLPYDEAIQQIKEFVDSATFIRNKQQFLRQAMTA